MEKLSIAAATPLILLLGLATVSYASAAGSYRPEVKTSKGISYFSGGFGIDEREAMHNMARNDTLELSFALQNRDYLAGAKVLIKDEKGHVVIETASDGPLFYAKLPQGKYTIMATAKGKTLTREAQIASKGQTRVYFAWPGAGRQMASPASAHKISHVSHQG
jgi:hypothetical protein